MTSFTAIAQKMSAQLKWTTATEVNNYGFEMERRRIQKSEDRSQNIEWAKVGFVPGNGTSNAPHNYSFTDAVLATGSYAYRLNQIDNSGSFKYSQETQLTIETPRVYALNQNYPNPFNPATIINYQIPVNSRVELKIYDMLGREIETLVNESQNTGDYSVTFNASNLPSGVYFYCLQTEGFKETKEMLLVK
jgi:hypothetical protein